MFLAMISGQQVVDCMLWVIIAGVIYWLLLWLLGVCGLPEPFNKVAKVLLAVVVVVILINAMLMLVNHPFISWR